MTNRRAENPAKLKRLISVEDDPSVSSDGTINLRGHFVMPNIRLTVWNLLREQIQKLTLIIKKLEDFFLNNSQRFSTNTAQDKENILKNAM